jgi:very-short-patch-repair endonuclease
MDGESEERWVTVADLAAHQHGRVASWQLSERELSRAWIEHKIRAGLLRPVGRGVYAVGHSGETEEARDMAAVLACGAGAVLSHWRAAARWELLKSSHGLIDVSVARHRRGVEGVRVHWVKLDPQDVTRRDSIPVTSVPRTLLDLAGVANPRQLIRATNNAVRAGRLTERVIADLTTRHPRRKGMAAFKAVTAALEPGTRQTRSDLEVAFLRLCRRRKIERPNRNVTVAGFLVDCHWPSTKLIVELDFYDYHRTPYEFDNDRRRDAHLKRLGFEVLRVSDQWLDSDPEGVAQTVEELLRRRAVA